VIQRQYTGTADRIENAQVAVYLVYAGLRRHAAVDREHDIPRSWTCDPDRCRAAGLGEETSFATKPELAARMIGQFLDAGHRVGWVAGDEVYGGTPKLRAALEERQVGYVLAYDWAVIDLAEVRPGSHRLLIRRNRTTGELAYYRCFSPTPVPMAAPARVAGSGGDRPGRKGPGRTGRAPTPPLHLMGPLGHPGHARARIPCRRPRRRVRPPPHSGRADSAYLQRDPVIVHDAGRPAHARCGPPASLVRLATPPPGPSPGQPLPPTSRESDMKITMPAANATRSPATFRRSSKAAVR
jgi:hypothetical protein